MIFFLILDLEFHHKFQIPFFLFPPQNSAKSSSFPVPAVPEKSGAKKGKGKACVNIPKSFNPLDQTCIHPESYHVAQRYSTHKYIICYKYTYRLYV